MTLYCAVVNVTYRIWYSMNKRGLTGDIQNFRNQPLPCVKYEYTVSEILYRRSKVLFRFYIVQ